MNKDKIVINDHIQGDPLSKENLDKTLNFLHKIRLSLPNKSIWIYSGYQWEQLFNGGVYLTRDCPGWKRREIVKQCNVLIDGRYIDSQRNPSKKWAGSDNQRVISIAESLKQGKVIMLE